MEGPEEKTGVYCPKCFTEMRRFGKIKDVDYTLDFTVYFYECPKCGYNDFDCK